MIGLIKKDLLMIKSNLKLMFIMFALFFIMAINGETDLSAIPVMISIITFLSTFSYDEYNKWNAYAITMPTGRKSIVKAKYIATMLMIIFSIIITILLQIIIGFKQNSINYLEIFTVMLGIFFAIIIMISILYPFIFKFGIEKARIALFIGIFGTIGIIELLTKSVNINIPSNLLTILNNYWLLILIILSVSTILISYKISEKIYLNKDF